MTREHKREYDRIWYQRHRERRVQQQKDRYWRNRESVRANDRLRRYGITKEEYDRRFKLQNGLCLLCEKPARRPLDVDHNHSTGKIRGLLCHLCNTALSRAENIIGWMERAKKYLDVN